MPARVSLLLSESTKTGRDVDIPRTGFSGTLGGSVDSVFVAVFVCLSVSQVVCSTVSVYPGLTVSVFVEISVSVVTGFSASLFVCLFVCLLSESTVSFLSEQFYVIS